MAPPRLPQQYIERLIGVLEAVPAIARRGVAGRADFVVQIHAGSHRITGFDPRQAPHDFATHLLGTAANLVPAYDGPRQGWTALGEILAVLLDDPAMRPADKNWIAALCVRYRLIPWDQPNCELTPEVYAALAAVPPQPPPYCEGGMFPPAMQREMQYDWLREALAAGNWQGVLSLAEALAANLAIPEVAATVRDELAARNLDLPTLIARAQDELARQP